MKKRIKINGVDYTDFLTPTGYTVSYEKRRGQNSGMMMDGSYFDDVLSVKAIITCSCMPLKETELSRVLVAIAGTYATVEFFDPMTNGYRSAEMMPSEATQRYKGTGSNSLDYWTGTVIQFKER